MEENNRNYIVQEQLENSISIESVLIKLNRLSHFMEHEVYTRQDIFQRSVYINFHSYFLENSRSVESLIERLGKKVNLLNDIENIIEDPKTNSYIRKIWDDIFTLLVNIEEKIKRTILRMENCINTNFKIDSSDYQKTHFIREKKTEKPNDNSWFYDNESSGDIVS